MSGSTVAVVNSRGQSMDTIYTAGGVKKLKLGVGSVDVAGDSDDAAWQGAATHANGATFAATDGVTVLAGVDSTTVRKLLVDTNGVLYVSVLPATGNLTDHSGSITAGGTQQTLMNSNTARKYLFIQNVSDIDMWINFGTNAVADQPSVKIEAGSSFAMEGSYVSPQSISIIGATTGKKFVAKEA